MANFDKQIKKQGESFSLEPRKEVWQRLEAELGKSKRRRFAGWLWMAPILLLAGTGLVYYTFSLHKKPIVNQEPATKEIKAKQSSEPNKIASTDNKATPKTNDVPVSTAVASPEKTSTQNSKSTNKKVVASNGLASKTVSRKETNSNSTEIISSVKSAPKKTEATNRHAANNSLLNNENISSEKIVSSTVKPSRELPVKDEKKSEVKENSALANNSAANIEEKGIIKKENPVTANDLPIISSNNNKAQNASITRIDKTTTLKKSKQVNQGVNWKLSLSAGASVNAESYSFLKIKRSSGDTDLATTVPPGLFEPMEKSKPGLSLGISVKRTQWLSKHWQWLVSSGVQLQQVHQYTGILYPDPITPSPDNFYGADYFFESGKKINHIGNNYRVFVANNLGYSPFKKIPGLVINAGVTVGANIYNRYLLPDSNFVLYIRSDEYYKKFYVGANAGIDYTLKNGVTIGATANHDFNKSNKPLDKNNHYWRSLLLNVSIPLSKTK